MSHRILQIQPGWIQVNALTQAGADDFFTENSVLPGEDTQFTAADSHTAGKSEALIQMPPVALSENTLSPGKSPNSFGSMIGPLFLPVDPPGSFHQGFMVATKRSNPSVPLHAGVGSTPDTLKKPDHIIKESEGMHCAWEYDRAARSYTNPELKIQLNELEVFGKIQLLGASQLEAFFAAVVPASERSSFSSDPSYWPTQIMRWVLQNPAGRMPEVYKNLYQQQQNDAVEKRGPMIRGREILKRMERSYDYTQKALQTLSTFGLKCSDGKLQCDVSDFKMEVFDKLEGLDANKLALAAVFCGMTYDPHSRGADSLMNKEGLGTWLLKQLNNTEQFIALVRVLGVLFPDSQDVQDLSSSLRHLTGDALWNANDMSYYLLEMSGIKDLDLAQEITLPGGFPDDPIQYPLSYFLRALLVIPPQSLVAYDPRTQHGDPQEIFNKAALTTKMVMLNYFVGNRSERNRDAWQGLLASNIHNDGIIKRYSQQFPEVFPPVLTAERLARNADYNARMLAAARAEQTTQASGQSSPTYAGSGASYTQPSAPEMTFDEARALWGISRGRSGDTISGADSGKFNSSLMQIISKPYTLSIILSHASELAADYHDLMYPPRRGQGKNRDDILSGINLNQNMNTVLFELADLLCRRGVIGYFFDGVTTLFPDNNSLAMTAARVLAQDDAQSDDHLKSVRNLYPAIGQFERVNDYASALQCLGIIPEKNQVLRRAMLAAWIGAHFQYNLNAFMNVVSALDKANGTTHERSIIIPISPDDQEIMTYRFHEFICGYLRKGGDIMSLLKVIANHSISDHPFSRVIQFIARAKG